MRNKLFLTFFLISISSYKSINTSGIQELQHYATTTITLTLTTCSGFASRCMLDDSANIRNTPIYDMAMESSRHIIVDYQNKMHMHIVMKELQNNLINIMLRSIVFLSTADLVHRTRAHSKEAGVYIFLLI